MKIAPVVLEMQKRQIPYLLLHTGQHYDKQMSEVFLEELKLPVPDISLGVGSNSQAKQTAAILTSFEEVCLQNKFDLVIVAGDVNSTMACALAAVKLNIPVAHVEAGLRSFDRRMPEEINRVVTDHVCDLLFTTEESANKNLRNEGIADASIHFVGNCMVDSLLKHLDSALKRSPWVDYHLRPQEYAMLTLHRPANVDDPIQLGNILNEINNLSRNLPIIFPAHPRTRKKMAESGLKLAAAVNVCEPMPYISFLGLMAKARYVLTDSGGIQEETTILQVPCFTLRPNTERPVTIEMGTNVLIGDNPCRVFEHINKLLSEKNYSVQRPPLWDGQAAVRIVDVIEKWVQARV
jgi:UDP-N-acetylglucosamine 2-epimerase (non-hydrolysing)